MNLDQQIQTKTENMNEAVKPEVKRVRRREWGRIIMLAFISLAAAIALTALHLLSPTVPGRAESFPARVSWYFAHGQWRPDSRTCAAAWDYFLQRENDMPTAATLRPVAAMPNETLPKS